MRVIQRFQRTAKLRHLAESTTRCYQEWIEDYLRYHRNGTEWRHPRDLKGPELGAYLTHQAADLLMIDGQILLAKRMTGLSRSRRAVTMG